VTRAVEFRYESGRQRYLLREWDTHGTDWSNDWDN